MRNINIGSIKFYSNYLFNVVLTIALFLILSKSNSFFIKKTVSAKLIFYSLLTQFNLTPIKNWTKNTL